MELAPFNEIMRELSIDMKIQKWNILNIDSEYFYWKLDMKDISNMIEELQTVYSFMGKNTGKESEVDYLDFLIEAKKDLKNNKK